MKKIMAMILCLVLMFSIVGCGTKKDEKTNTTTKPKSEQESEQESGTEKVAENIEMDEEPLNVVEICVQYLSENEPAEVMSSITNLKKPEIRTISELPDSVAYMKISDEAGTGPYDIVMFTTTTESPVELIVNQEKQIVGIFYRE